MSEKSDSTLGAQNAGPQGISWIDADPELSVDQLKPGVPQSYEEQRGPIQTSLYISLLNAPFLLMLKWHFQHLGIETLRRWAN